MIQGEAKKRNGESRYLSNNNNSDDNEPIAKSNEIML